MVTNVKSRAAAKHGQTPVRPARPVRQRAAQTATYLRSVDDLFKARFNISALRPAARLLLLLAARQSATITEAMNDSVLSYRAFYVMLDTLKGQALVRVEPDKEDLRIRRLVPGANFDRIAKDLREFDRP
jgi:hypothetical protein